MWILWIITRRSTGSANATEGASKRDTRSSFALFGLWHMTQYSTDLRLPPWNWMSTWQPLHFALATIVRRDTGCASVTANASGVARMPNRAALVNGGCGGAV